MEKFILSPLQELWLQSLETHPERQTKSKLGYGTPEDYEACCLGEGLLCIARFEGKNESDFFNFEGNIFDIGEDIIEYMDHSYHKLGLFSNEGKINYTNAMTGITDVLKTTNGYPANSLSVANDNDVSWTDIAAFIRKYPETVFRRSM